MIKPQAPWPLNIQHQEPEVHFAETSLSFRTAPRDERQIEKAAQEKLATLLRQIPDELAALQLDLPALLGIRQQLRRGEQEAP